MQDFEFHPIAEHFPKLSQDRFSELAGDIRSNGLIHPIMLFEGKILDGRNRYLACLETGTEPRFVQFSGRNPWTYVWSENGQRRDLTDDQRYAVWKRIEAGSENWQASRDQAYAEANRKRSAKAKGNQNASKDREKNSGSTSSATSVSKTGHEKGQQAKAAASGTNRGAVARVDALDNKRPDLTERVIAGDLTVTAALREMRRDELKESVPELPTDKYRVIYADPPWKYGNSGLDSYGHAESHYPSMTIDQICSLNVRNMVEDDSVLFLWVTSPMLEDSFRIVTAWGFKYKSSFVWDKVKHNFGNYNSVRHEFLLVCTRGSCTPDQSELFDSVQVIERLQHSAKPDAFRSIIESLYTHGKKLELFARKKAAGWDSWGNEVKESEEHEVSQSV